MPKDHPIDQRMSKPNALALQYQRDNIGASGDLHVNYVGSHSDGHRVRGIFGAGFTEELPSLVRAEICSGN
jgi:hypothetical protein